MSLTRIWVLAVNVFREVIRDRILYIIGLFAVLQAIAQRLLQEVAATTENKIYLDFGVASISIFSVIVAVFVGTGLINKEIEKRTVLALIPKPITRAELIIGKHLGLSGVLGVLVAAMTVIYLAFLSWSQIPYSFGALLISIFYLFIELSLLTSVALLFGVFTSSLIAVILTFAVYLAGHLSQDIVKLGDLSKNPELQQLIQSLYLVLPDLSRLDLKNQAVYGLLPSPETLITNGLYGFLYTILLLAIAILIFTRRQF